MSMNTFCQQLIRYYIDIKYRTLSHKIVNWHGLIIYVRKLNDALGVECRTRSLRAGVHVRLRLLYQ